jgi:hypothetical protein
MSIILLLLAYVLAAGAAYALGALAGARRQAKLDLRKRDARGRYVK